MVIAILTGQLDFYSYLLFGWLTFYLLFCFYLGGYGDIDNVNLDLAAKYDGKWERVGSLMQPRRGHRSLVRGS